MVGRAAHPGKAPGRAGSRFDHLESVAHAMRLRAGLMAPPHREVRQILEMAQHRCWGAGDLITGRLDRERLLYILVDGDVRVSIATSEGREFMLFRRRRCGDIFQVGGIGPDVGDEMVAEIVADETVFLTVARSQLFDRVTSYPRAAMLLVALAHDLTLEERARTAEFGLHDVESRVRSTLIRLAREAPDGVTAITHDELAERVGTDRARVTKLLGKLADLGLIECERRSHRIRILNWDELALPGAIVS